MNIMSSDQSAGKSTVLLIFRIFPDVSPDAGFDSKSIQKTSVLLHGYVTSLIWSVWPLETTVAQTKRKQAESYAFKEQAFDPVLLYTAEEEQRPYL